MATTIEREAELTALSDELLVQRVYELVGQVGSLDDSLASELYWHLGEAFERFAPAVEWADAAARCRDLADPESELESTLAGARRRWEARRRREAGLMGGDDA